MTVVVIEAAVRTADSRLQNLLSEALIVYLRAHFNQLQQNKPVMMTDLSHISSLDNEMLKKLLMGKSELMDLSKAELLVTLYVEKLHTNDFVVPDDVKSVDLDYVLMALNKMQLLNQGGKKDVDQVIWIDDNTRFEFLFYHYVDQPMKDLDINIETSNQVMDKFDGITLNSDDTTLGLSEREYLQNALSETPEQVQVFFNQSIDLKVLPSSKFQNIWHDLKLENNLKSKVFNQLKQKILWNPNDQGQSVHGNSNLFLFHGPPGSGKSTFCKSLSQKLSIQNQSQNESNTLLLQISCEKIFSKWYGESAQNLNDLFKIIKTMIIQNPTCPIILIIDEIETLANSRSQTLVKNETSDSIRVVNALLTILDSLNEFKNFSILCTSNLIESIDEAFLDRCDGCFGIGQPNSFIIKQILSNEISKLINSGALINDIGNINDHKINRILEKSSQICENELKSSGRTISKIPQFCVLELITSYSNQPILMSVFLQTLANFVISKATSLSQPI